METEWSFQYGNIQSGNVHSDDVMVTFIDDMKWKYGFN